MKLEYNIPPSDVAYGSSWNGDLQAATKNAIYDKIELVVAGKPFTTSTDPASSDATTTAIVDAYGGVVITTTAAGNAQTIANPTLSTAGKDFTVVNNDTSSDAIAVNGIDLAVGTAQRYVWDGSAWAAVEAVDAGDITNVPAGNIAATNVQAALNELDTEKAALAGAIFTGNITGSDAAGPAFVNEAAAATNPTLVPNKVELDTGIAWAAADTVTIVTGGTEALRIDSVQNMGLGVTPEDWRSTFTAFQISATSALSDNGSGVLNLTENAYYDDSDNRWEYITTSHASKLDMFDGTFTFGVAASGTADNPITWTAALTIENDGDALFAQKVGIGTATPQAKLDVVGGDIHIDATQKIYLDGGSNTYITEASADVISLIAGGFERLSVNDGGNVGMASGGKLFLDGVARTGDTYIYESSADNMRFVAGTTIALDIEPDGDALFFQKVGIGVSPSSYVEVRADQNAMTDYDVQNNTSDTAAGVEYNLTYSGGSGVLRGHSAGFTTSNQYQADSILLEASSSSGGLILSATGGAFPIEFWNNSTLSGQFEGDGDLFLASGNKLGIGISPTSPLHINLGTENLEVVDSGSAAATEQDWIEVEVGGNQGYIRVFAAK